MPQPTASDVLFSPQLTTASVAYLQSATNFVAGQVFPTLPSEVQAGKIVSWNRDDWLRVAAKVRGPGDPAARSGFNLSRISFSITPYAVAKPIDDQTKANQAAPINLEMTATKWVTQQLMMIREQVWATNFYKTGIWATDVTGETSAPSTDQVLKWSEAGSTPVDDVALYKDQIATVSGLEANILVLSRDTYRTLKNNAEIQDRIKYGATPGSPSVVNLQALGALFEVDKVLVARAVNETAGEGVTDTYATILGAGQALLAYAAPEPGVDTPSAGYNVAWTGYIGAGAEGNRIKSFRDENVESDIIEGSLAQQPLMIASDLGVLFNSLV